MQKSYSVVCHINGLEINIKLKSALVDLDLDADLPNMI